MSKKWQNVRLLGSLFILLLLILACSILFLTSLDGFISIAKQFDDKQTGFQTFVSFIVLSLTLAILAYTISPQYNRKKKAQYQRIGKQFAISSMLFFVSYMALNGLPELIKNLEHEITAKYLPELTEAIIIAALVFAVVNFIWGLFIFLATETGVLERAIKDLKDAQTYYSGIGKTKKAMAIGIAIVYTIVIVIAISLGYL